jgi:signal transduction histidine kinase
LACGLPRRKISVVELLRPEVASAESTNALEDELVARALAIAGCPRTARRCATISRRTVKWLDDCETRVRAVSLELPSTAVLDFLGEALAALARESLLPTIDAGAVVLRVATELRVAPEMASLLVYRRAIASRHCLALPTELATELVLTLLVDLGPADSVSLWTTDETGGVRDLAGAGRAPFGRRLRDAGEAALKGEHTSSLRFVSVVVERWDQPFAALAASGIPADAQLLHAHLAEAAIALSSVLERDAIFERNAECERTIVAAGERRLARLGFDLHDGPLQEMVALAENIRYAHSKIAPLVDASYRHQLAGCFEDLEAQLVALDGDIRQIAHSIRPTTAVERPLESALRAELDALSRASAIEVDFSVDGDLSGLTDSQRIVIFRVVQESLANVRKHSEAGHVSVRIETDERLIALTVADDGRGFDVTKAVPSSRLGLAGVSERVRLLGGDLEMESHVGQGTTIRASLPRWRPSAADTAPVYAVAT